MLSTIVTVLRFCDVFTESFLSFLNWCSGVITNEQNFVLAVEISLLLLVFSKMTLSVLCLFLVILELVDDIGPTNDINLKLWYLDDGILLSLQYSFTLRADVKSKGPRYGLH